MKFTIPKSDLLRALARCQSVADAKSTMPILANVYLEADGGRLPGGLTVAATDLHRSVVTLANATVDNAGSLCLPARELFERIKVMPDGQLAFSVEGTKATIKAIGSSRRFVMHGIPGDEFPTLPQRSGSSESTLSASASTLVNLIAATMFSVSTDETRLHLNSLLIESDRKGTIRMVSTDGHRMSVIGGEPDAAHSPWLVPLAGVRDLKRLFEESQVKGAPAVQVELTEDKGTLFAKLPEFTFSVKLCDAAFPPWKQVRPDTTERQVEVNRSALVDALRAVSIAANDRTGGVTMTFRAGTLRLESESPDSGEGFDELECSYAGKEVRIGFNARYFLDALSAIITDSVSIETSGDLDPAMVRPVGGGSEYTAVVMPMRVA